jgi:hypothetical protein
MAKVTRDEFFDHLDEHREHALDTVGAGEDAKMSLPEWLLKLTQGMRSIVSDDDESSDGDDLVGDDGDDMLLDGDGDDE